MGEKEREESIRKLALLRSTGGAREERRGNVRPQQFNTNIATDSLMDLSPNPHPQQQRQQKASVGALSDERILPPTSQRFSGKKRRHPSSPNYDDIDTQDTQ